MKLTKADIKQKRAELVEVLLKMDKLKKSEIEKNLATIRQDLELPEDVRLIPFSAEKGLGKEDLVKMIMWAVKNG